jgi:hypothetical protein
MVKVYGASLLPQVLFNSLGQLVIYLYMIRKKRLPILPTLGLSFFFIFADFGVMAVVLTAALALDPQPDPIIFTCYGLILVGLLIGAWYFPGQGGKRLLPFLYHNPLALSLRRGQPSHYLQLIALRLLFPFFQMAGHFLALRAMGINPPFPDLIVIVTAMTFTTFLPVSALGFGAPNLVALALAPYVLNPQASQETALAYGLLFQTGFLLGRAVIGLAFAIPFWHELITRPNPETSMGAEKTI